MNEKMSEGLAHDKKTTHIIVIVKACGLWARFRDRTVSELRTASGATFRAQSVTTLPRAEALGCSVGPFHGQSAAGTRRFTSSLFPIGSRGVDRCISIS
jgi:hypothetical protein